LSSRKTIFLASSAKDGLTVGLPFRINVQEGSTGNEKRDEFSLVAREYEDEMAQQEKWLKLQVG